MIAEEKRDFDTRKFFAPHGGRGGRPTGRSARGLRNTHNGRPLWDPSIKRLTTRTESVYSATDGQGTIGNFNNFRDIPENGQYVIRQVPLTTSWAEFVKQLENKEIGKKNSSQGEEREVNDTDAKNGAENGKEK